MTIQVTITDAPYNCPTDGTSECRTAFQAFRADHQFADIGDELVELTCPAHTYTFIDGFENYIFGGVRNLLVLGIGATFKDGYTLGGKATVFDDVHDIELASDVSAGATSITVTDAVLAASLFAADDWCMMGGFDLQGIFDTPYGDPANLHYFEYIQIDSVVSDVITFKTPLQYGYKTTWPRWNNGDAFHSDNGGPGSIFYLDPWFNCDHEYRGFTIDRPDNQTYTRGRKIVFRECPMTGIHGPIPTACKEWSAYDMDYSAVNIEVDKLVSLCTFDNCSIDLLKFQSSSVGHAILNNVTILTGMSGTPKTCAITGGTYAGLQLGAFAYGKSTSVNASNASIASITQGGGSENAANGVENNWTITDGIISIPTGTRVTAAAASGGNTRLTVDSTAGFVDGKQYTFAGLHGHSYLTNARVYTIVDGTHFDLATAYKDGVALTSISQASPAVFTLNSHGLLANDTIRLVTTGSLPSGLATGTTYYMMSVTANTFGVSTTYDGANPVNTSSAGSGTHSFSSFYVSGSGLITTVASGEDNPTRYMVPGGYGWYQNGLPFQITDVTQDANKTYVHTTSALDAFPPNVSGYFDQQVISIQGIESATFISCTGSPTAVDLSNPGAQGRPLYSYSKRTYTDAGSGDDIQLDGSMPSVRLFGYLDELRITVNSAYAGGALTFKPFGQFKAAGYEGPDYDAATNWTCTINLEEVGTRAYTRAGGWTGLKTGDTLPEPVDLWLAGEQGPFVSATPGSAVSVTVETFTDQGIPLQAEASSVGTSARVRLRLR